MIKWVKDHGHFGRIQEKYKEFLILLFYGDFSSNAKRALVEIGNFSKENKELPVYIVDVGKIKGVHKQFEVENVPTKPGLSRWQRTRRMKSRLVTI